VSAVCTGKAVASPVVLQAVNSALKAGVLMQAKVAAISIVAACSVAVAVATGSHFFPAKPQPAITSPTAPAQRPTMAPLVENEAIPVPQQPAPAIQKPDASAWRDLFNGKDLSGW